METKVQNEMAHSRRYEFKVLSSKNPWTNKEKKNLKETRCGGAMDRSGRSHYRWNTLFLLKALQIGKRWRENRTGERMEDQLRDRLEDEYLIECLPRQIIATINGELTREISDLEVRHALFQLGGSRAPGSDDFSGSFFQRKLGCRRSKHSHHGRSLPLSR